MKNSLAEHHNGSAAFQYKYTIQSSSLEQDNKAIITKCTQRNTSSVIVGTTGMQQIVIDLFLPIVFSNSIDATYFCLINLLYDAL
jgi:hypothetical protein